MKSFNCLASATVREQKTEPWRKCRKQKEQNKGKSQEDRGKEEEEEKSKKEMKENMVVPERIFGVSTLLNFEERQLVRMTHFY